MPLFRVYDYQCPECEVHERDKLVTVDTKDDQECECGAMLERMVSSCPHWSPSRERTLQQLKTRSEEDSKLIHKRGYGNESYGGQFRGMRHRKRKKITREGRVKELANSHKGWEEKPRVERISRSQLK